MRTVVALIVAAFLSISFGGAIHAQTPLELRGQIVDAAGSVIDGAKVTLTAGAQPLRVQLSDQSGAFSFAQVTTGAHQLTIEKAGFQRFETSITLDAHTGTLKVVLTVANLEAATEVGTDTNTISIEPDRSLTATVLDEPIIETLPDDEDELRDYLQALAGPGAGGVAGGQAGAQIYVDGFRGRRLPQREAILQIRINQDPFGAQYSQPGSGRVEIITKPGNSQWHGSSAFNVFNTALNARNAFAPTKAQLDQRRYSATLSGPVIHKRMSFFANAESRNLDGTGTVNAQTLEGPLSLNVPSTSLSRSIGIRVEYLLGQKHVVNAGYTGSRSAADNREFAARGGGVSTFTLPERGSDMRSSNKAIRLSAVSVPGKRLVHESRIEAALDRRVFTSRTKGRSINVLDAFYGGGASCCPNEMRESALEWQDLLTLSLGRQTLQAGFQFEHNRMSSVVASNFNGTYTFSSLEEYRRVIAGERIDPANPNSDLVRPAQFTMSQGDPSISYSRYEAAWFIQDDIRFNPRLTVSLGLRHEFQSQLADRANFAPRLGVALLPTKNRRTAIRFGGGFFYSRLAGNVFENTLRYDGRRQQILLIRNPSYPDPFASSPVIEERRSVRRSLDPDLRAPYVFNFVVSVEHQFSRTLFGSMNYSFIRGVHQFRSRNINAPLPVSGVRPNPLEGNDYQIESSARSRYQGVTLKLDRRLSRSFTMYGIYTISMTKSDSDGPFSLPMNNYDLRPEWSLAASDRRHHFVFGGSALLPWKMRLNPYVTVNSGAPFNITTGLDDNRDTVINDRPAGIARNSALPAVSFPLITDRCLSGCAAGGSPIFLSRLLATRFPEGIDATGPGSINANLSVSRSFTFGHRASASTRSETKPRAGGGSKASTTAKSETGRYSIQLSAQATNILNKVNFYQYSGVLSSPFFGRASGAAPPRQIELSLRFSF